MRLQVVWPHQVLCQAMCAWYMSCCNQYRAGVFSLHSVGWVRGSAHALAGGCNTSCFRSFTKQCVLGI
jgi:hypothetical protein